MHDQAEGLRQRRKDVRILSVLSLPGLAGSAVMAWRVALAWSRLGGRPLLVDGTGKSADRLLGCHPLLEWSALAGKAFEDCVLIQEGRAAVVAKGLPAGDAGLVGQAAKLGYRDLVFDGGEFGAEDAPLDAACSQDLCLLAEPDRMETVYALLKGLQQVHSPARIWLLWHNHSPEAKRLEQVCRQRLGRIPRFLGGQFISPMKHDLHGSGTSAPLNDNDIRAIVATMLAEQSLRGEETPSTIERHA